MFAGLLGTLHEGAIETSAEDSGGAWTGLDRTGTAAHGGRGGGADLRPRDAWGVPPGRDAPKRDGPKSAHVRHSLSP